MLGEPSGEEPKPSEASTEPSTEAAYGGNPDEPFGIKIPGHGSLRRAAVVPGQFLRDVNTARGLGKQAAEDLRAEGEHRAGLRATRRKTERDEADADATEARLGAEGRVNRARADAAGDRLKAEKREHAAERGIQDERDKSAVHGATAQERRVTAATRILTEQVREQNFDLEELAKETGLRRTYLEEIASNAPELFTQIVRAAMDPPKTPGEQERKKGFFRNMFGGRGQTGEDAPRADVEASFKAWQLEQERNRASGESPKQIQNVQKVQGEVVIDDETEEAGHDEIPQSAPESEGKDTIT